MKLNFIESLLEDMSDAVSTVNANKMALTPDNITLTGKDVVSHINKQYDELDEPETVTFGLETDDDQIVKVYVNVDDADNFEQAMAKELGGEDSIEDILERLSDEFDIVDVEWPAEDEDEANYNFDEDEDEDEVKSDAQKDIDEFKNDKDEQEDFDNSITGEDEAKKTDEEPEAVPDDGESGKEETEETDETDEEEPEEEGEGEEDEDEDRDEKKKKKNTKEMTYGQKFLQRVVSEAAIIDGEAIDAKADHLIHEITDKYKKLGINALIALGVPGDVLAYNKNALKRNLEEFRDLSIEDATLRIWTKKLIDILSEPGNVDIKEDEEIIAHVSSKITNILNKLIVKLGVPADAIKAKRTLLKNMLLKKAKVIARDPRAKIALAHVADALGLDADMEAPKLVDITKESVMEADDDINYAGHPEQLFLDLFKLLGLPDANLNYQHSMALGSVKNKARQLRTSPNGSTIMQISKRLHDLVMAAPTNQPVTAQEGVVTESLNWAIAKVDGQIMLTGNGKQLSIAADNAKKLIDAIAAGEIISVKDTNDVLITFRPSTNGYKFKLAGEHVSYELTSDVLKTIAIG